MSIAKSIKKAKRYVRIKPKTMRALKRQAHKKNRRDAKRLIKTGKYPRRKDLTGRDIA